MHKDKSENPDHKCHPVVCFVIKVNVGCEAPNNIGGKKKKFIPCMNPKWYIHVGYIN